MAAALLSVSDRKAQAKRGDCPECHGQTELTPPTWEEPPGYFRTHPRGDMRKTFVPPGLPHKDIPPPFSDAGRLTQNFQTRLCDRKGQAMDEALGVLQASWKSSRAAPNSPNSCREGGASPNHVWFSSCSGMKNCWEQPESLEVAVEVTLRRPQASERGHKSLSHNLRREFGGNYLNPGQVLPPCVLPGGREAQGRVLVGALRAGEPTHTTLATTCAAQAAALHLTGPSGGSFSISSNQKPLLHWF